MVVTTRDPRSAKSDYLRQAIMLENELQQLLDDWGVDVHQAMLEHSSSSGIKDTTGLLAALTATVTLYLVRFGETMNDSVGRIAKLRAQSALERSVPLLRSVNATKALHSFKADMENFAEYAKRTWQSVPYGSFELTFLDRMEAIDLSSKKTITNIIQLGVKDGLGSRDIEKLLQSYINPKDGKPGKPYDIARKLLKADMKYLPKNVLPGSIQSNLYSIARTGSAEMYRNMTDWMYEKADWVDGYDWVLSRSHPREDMCDELAAASPYPKNAERPFSHNHCLCDWVEHLKTPKELRAMLDRGDSLYNRN